MKKVQSAKSLLVIATLTGSMILSSCIARLGDFTVISSKNVNLNFPKSQGVSVSGTSLGLFGIGADIEEAIDKALRDAGPDADLLVDAVVKLMDFYFVSGYKVEGVAISSSKMKAELGEEGFKKWCKAHKVFDPSTATIQTTNEN